MTRKINLIIAALTLWACTSANDALQGFAEDGGAGADAVPPQAEVPDEVPAWRKDPAVPDLGDEVENSFGLRFRLVPAGQYDVGLGMIGIETHYGTPYTLPYDVLVATTETPRAVWEQLRGVDLGDDLLPWRPSGMESVAEVANAMSDAEGLERCYPATNAETPLPGCLGYRLPLEDEFFIAWSDHRPPPDYYPAEECAPEFAALAVCYSCTCGTSGPLEVGASRANRFGLRDMLGNMGELVHTGGGGRVFERGGNWTTPAQVLADPSAFNDGGADSPTAGARFVRRLP